MSASPRANETSICPPHWWDLDRYNRGFCRKCGAVIDLYQTFAEETAGRRHSVLQRKYPKTNRSIGDCTENRPKQVFDNIQRS